MDQTCIDFQIGVPHPPCKFLLCSRPNESQAQWKRCWPELPRQLHDVSDFELAICSVLNPPVVLALPEPSDALLARSCRRQPGGAFVNSVSVKHLQMPAWIGHVTEMQPSRTGRLCTEPYIRAIAVSACRRDRHRTAGFPYKSLPVWSLSRKVPDRGMTRT